MNEGWEGAWQTRYWIAFSSSPAVHAVFSPLPCRHMWWCVCDVHLNMAADAWCSLKAAAATDFVYRIYNQTADVYKLLGKIVCVSVCVCKTKGNLCFVASLKKQMKMENQFESNTGSISISSNKFTSPITQTSAKRTALAFDEKLQLQEQELFDHPCLSDYTLYTKLCWYILK